MKKLIATIIALVMIVSTFSIAIGAGIWRSALYPVDWQPGYTDSEGRFLQDFSYAGYHKGEKQIPIDPPGNVFSVTSAPYNADNTGIADSREAIQKAINDAEASGGGVVYIPEGTYRVRPVSGNSYVCKITSSNVVIKGAGTDKTFIYNDDTYMRGVAIFHFGPDGFTNWHEIAEVNPTLLTADAVEMDTVLKVQSVTGYNVGDWIMARIDTTAAFIAEHYETGRWNTELQPLMFYRKITKIDSGASEITIDIPVRYKLKTRDRARIHKIALEHISEVGIQDMAFGMLENTKAGLGEEDYNTNGTAAYDCHNAVLVRMNHIVDGWIKNIATYKPAVNTKNVHILSCGVNVTYCRNVTVTETNMQLPLYEGGGGNGYLHNIKGQECLFTNCYAYHGRHNYSFGGLYCSGNVLTSSKTVSAYKETDMHMHLSPANLMDNMYVSGDQLEAINRNEYGTTNRHGQTTTQTVFWNTNGISYQSGESSIVENQQFGIGYVIGTRGSAYKVSAITGDNTEPIDYVEGVGLSDTLEPQSLYADQLQKRFMRMSLPQVSETLPRNGGKLYFKDSASIDFDTEMVSLTVTDKASIQVTPQVDYDLTYNEALKRCIVSFPSGLTANTEYTIAVKSDGVRSTAGETLISDKLITFTAAKNPCETSGIQVFVGDDYGQSKATLKNNRCISVQPMLIIAIYKDDMLQGIEMAKSSIDPGAGLDIQTPVLAVKEGLEDYYFRSYLWETESVQPYAKSEKKLWDEISKLTFNPVADSYTRNGGTYQNENYGNIARLDIKNGSSNFYRKAYFKFDFTNSVGTPKKATLRLFGANTTDTASVTAKLYQIADDSWEEDKITWVKSPAMGTLIGNIVLNGEHKYIEIDVTSFVTEQASIDRIVSFGIDPPFSQNAFVNSREAETNRPELVLEY